MAHVLPWESRARIVSALAEGNSLRATSRMFKTDKNTTRDFALRVGEGCALLHNRLVRGVSSYMLECDERWSFIHTKEARVDPTRHPAEWGDVYTFVALDAVAKLVIAYHVGKRDEQGADAFIADLRGRLTVVPQMATDGFQPYEPPRDPFITKRAVYGAPDMDKLSTSYIERQNLTMRHIVGRTRRLCLAFSKTLRGHRAAEALGFMAYNFVRVHSTLGCTPAMAAGLADHPWTIGELMDAALAAEPCEAPTPCLLALRPGSSVARELPNGRGFLRVISGGKASPAGPEPEAPTPAPVAPVAPPVAAPADDDPQLSFLDWRPRPMKPLPPKGTQLNMFGEPDV